MAHVAALDATIELQRVLPRNTKHRGDAIAFEQMHQCLAARFCCHGHLMFIPALNRSPSYRWYRVGNQFVNNCDHSCVRFFNTEEFSVNAEFRSRSAPRCHQLSEALAFRPYEFRRLWQRLGGPIVWKSDDGCAGNPLPVQGIFPATRPA